jgi:hypothetical protein
MDEKNKKIKVEKSDKNAVQKSKSAWPRNPETFLSQMNRV